MKKLFILLYLLVFALFVNAQDRLTGQEFTTRSEVLAKNGMAATSQPLATQAALRILQQGGSAMDAAIAANAVLGLVEPASCGIGGDIFAIIWDAKTQKLYGFNGSGRSPKSLNIDYFMDRGMEEIPLFGPLAISTPGTVDGWFMMHEKFGKLAMTDILAPAIDYGREGFPVSEVIAYEMATNYQNKLDFPGFSETYLPNGHPPIKGEVFVNADLADTYELLANKGRDVFYQGEIAKTRADSS